jgi:alkanesulfonate monooxygenase SsuD/methylene tetrahydromethanopterin reductase-like flavin-dependent oxidoreductase (luciferase family)
MRAQPETQHPPQTFVLDASGSTAEFAARTGRGFTFAHFINPGNDGPQAAKEYCAAFQATEFAAQLRIFHSQLRLTGSGARHRHQQQWQCRWSPSAAADTRR